MEFSLARTTKNKKKKESEIKRVIAEVTAFEALNGMSSRINLPPSNGYAGKRFTSATERFARTKPFKSPYVSGINHATDSESEAASTLPIGPASRIAAVFPLSPEIVKDAPYGISVTVRSPSPATRAIKR